MGQAFLFPGQGSQISGMGGAVLAAFPELVAAADRILGYSVRELCASEERLDQTEYAQPALFVVNALTYLRERDRYGPPRFLAGHSLGEWSALFAAGCVDFETGLRLVHRRGELMARAGGGGMMAVLGVPLPRLLDLLTRAGVDDVDVANHNAPEQVVLAGPRAAAETVAGVLKAEGVGKYLHLSVSVAAHSRYMVPAAREFRELLAGVRFAEPAVPVIANVTGQPHTRSTMVDLLSQHLCCPVRWWDTLCLLATEGVEQVVELGPGEVLQKMWHRERPQLPPRARRPGVAGS